MVFISTPSSSLDAISCPGLFYPTTAQDGILTRIRTPGGLLTGQQIAAITALANSTGLEQLQVTNRANLQLKLSTVLNPDLLCQLQTVGLAGPIAAVDHLRNIMASPTAGIDTESCLDTRPIVTEIDRYLATSSKLAGMSPKFSVGLDGGESLSIRQCPNDVLFVAEAKGLRLVINLGDGYEWDTDLICPPQQIVELLQTICHIYLAQAESVAKVLSPHRRSRLPRLRQLIAHRGQDWWLRELIEQVPGLELSDRSSSTSRPEGGHLGAHRQQQSGYAYVGLVLPLGQLSIAQLQALGTIARQYGSDTLRLTPWQNILLPDVPVARLPQVLQELSGYGLNAEAHQPAGSIVACRGKLGCQAAETQSQIHAQLLIQQLVDRLDHPLTIHVSGCAKGCARPYGSDIALLGVTHNQSEGYEIYIRSGNHTFGQLLYPALPVAQALETVDRLLRVYQHQRRSAAESWHEFIDRNPPSNLHQLIDTQSYQS